MGYVALDLSKSSTGCAAWQPGWDKPRVQTWQLGSNYTTDGGVFAKLHEKLTETHRVLCRIDCIFAEEPINPAQLKGNTTIQTIRLATGISAHVHSWAHAMGVRRLHEFNVSSWRPDFIGRIADAEAKSKARRLKKAGDARASARKDLKALTKARCRQLGLSPRNDDEADAIGILTYGLLTSNITPPWIEGEVLQVPLEI